MIIADFITLVSSRAGHNDPNALAALMESWQFFEMEYGSNPSVVHRVAKLVVTDAKFHPLLEKGARERGPWLRDAAGIIIRLNALSIDGDLDVGDSDKKLLKRCYSAILEVTSKMAPSG